MLAADDPDGAVHGRRAPPAGRRVLASTTTATASSIVTNDEAENFRLVEAPVDAPGGSNWRDVIAHRADTRISPSTRSPATSSSTSARTG